MRMQRANGVSADHHANTHQQCTLQHNFLPNLTRRCPVLVRSGRSPRDSPGHAVASTVAATTSSNCCSKLEPLLFRHPRRWRIDFTRDVTSDDERVTAKPSEVKHYTTWCLRRAEFLQAIPFSPHLCRDVVIVAIQRDLLRQSD